MSDGIIGSVGVAVVPDSTDFWRRFEAQTRAGATEAGRRAGADWRRGFESGSEGRPVVVPVRTDTTRVRADLEGLRAQLANIGDARIDMGSVSATQLASMTAATNHLSDAQDRLRRARAELDAVSRKEGVTEKELADAQRAVARAERDQELAGLRLAASQEAVAAAQDRARAAAERQAAAAQRQANSTKSAKTENQGLLSSLLALAPALVPLAGAAALGGAALAEMGAAGVLAFKGIQADIKAANADGVQFAAGLGVLKGDLGAVEQTAAHNVLGAFQEATAKLHADMPAVNNDLGQASQVLGSIAGHVLGGLIGGLRNFSPALLTIEQGVNGVAAKFESWATGPGGEKFAQALIEDFHHIEPLIENVAVAVGHLVAGANGTGLAIVDELNVFAGVLAKLPPSALAALTAGIVSLRIASTVSGLMSKLAGSIRDVEDAEGGAGGAAGGFRGRLGSVVDMIGKVTAAWAAASIAIGAADQATQSWATSANGAEYGTHYLINTFQDLLSFNFKGFWGDITGTGAAKQAAEMRGHILAIDDATKLLAKDIGKATTEKLYVSGNKYGYTGNTGNFDPNQVAISNATRVANQEAKTYQATIRGLMTTVAQFYTQVGNAPLSQATQAYTQQASSIDKADQSLQKFLTSGAATSYTYKGITVGVNAWDAALKKTNGDVVAAEGIINGQIDALLKQQGVYGDLSEASLRLAEATGAASAKYKLSADQVDTYAAALGISAEKVANGTISQLEFVAAIGQVQRAIGNGSTAIQTWVAAIATFNKASDTAANRATLIGAALVAANGDLLGYANTMASAATANQQLVTDFKNLGKGVLDLKTGTIDYHRAGAAPLLNDLQQLQTAAMNAASATYQHELATKGAKQAASDAFDVYKNDTRGALMDEATHLGLTKDEAKKLADQYFGIKNSGDLKKQIELLGGDKVNAALKGILQDLDIMAGKTTVLNVEIQAHNAANISSGRGVATGGTAKHYASGTGQGGLPEGWSWVGDPGPHSELIHKQGNRADVLSHTQSVAMAAKLGTKVPGFASGTESGGFSGVDYSGNANKNGVVKNSSSSAISSLLSASHALAQTAASSSSTASDIQSASQSLNDAAKSAKVSQAERAYLTARESQLTSLARQRDAVEARLGTAPSAPTAYERLGDAQSKLQGERSTVSGAVSGSFNVSSAGQQQYGEPLTFASINSDLRKAVANATAFNSALHRLAKEGLNKTLLQQLAEAGPQALPQAKALLAATPKQLASLNSEYRALGKQSASAGSFIANDLYKAGVDSAQGLVNGLKSKESALNKEMRKIGQSMAAELRSSLGIKSPSKVTHEIGLFTGEGLRLGLAAKRAAIAAEATRMGNAAIPAGIRSLNDPAFGGGGATQTIHLAQHIHNPIPEPPSRTSPAALRRAAYALGR